MSEQLWMSLDEYLTDKLKVMPEHHRVQREYREMLQRVRELEARPDPANPELKDAFFKRIRELKEENEQLKAAIGDVACLMGNSEGVYGLHQNGDHAPWDELRTGGSYEEWLYRVDAAIDAAKGQGDELQARARAHHRARRLSGGV